MGTRTLRYTGARTERASVAVHPYGVLKIGDVVEVPDDVAERWLAQQPTRDYGTIDEFEGSWTLEQLRVMARDHRLDDSGKKRELAERIFAQDPTVAPQKTASDFEDAGDAKATVVRFTDRTAPPAPAPQGSPTAEEAQNADEGEGVTDGR